MVVAPAPQHRRPPATGVVERLLRQAGLADARLALDDHQVAEAAEGDVDAGAQPAQFGPPPDQRTRHRVSVGLTTPDERGTPAPRTRCRARDERQRADAPEHAPHVVRRRERGRLQRGDADVERGRDHEVEQPGAEAVALLGVLHQQADLGGAQPGAEQAGDADDGARVAVDDPRPLPGRRVDDVGEVPGGELRHRGQEAAVAGGRAAPLEHGDELGHVIRVGGTEHPARRQFETVHARSWFSCRLQGPCTSWVVSDLPPMPQSPLRPLRW